MGLTNRRRLFVEFYLQTWNASEAARLAGYTGAANRIGSRLLLSIDIQQAIKARMDETELTSDEILRRLADQARLNLMDFVSEKTRDVYDKNGNLVDHYQTFEVDFEALKRRGHMIKSIAATQYGVKLEAYDAQTALIKLGTAAGVLTERIDQHTTTEQVEVHLYMPENGRDDHS